MATLIKTIKGIVRNGKVEPSEGSDAPDGKEVSIQIPIKDAERTNKMITFGMFAGPIETT